VVVEKLASEKSAKTKTRQEALQTIFFDHLDIVYSGISTCFTKKGVFQQPPLLSTPIVTMTRFRQVPLQWWRRRAGVVECGSTDRQCDASKAPFANPTHRNGRSGVQKSLVYFLEIVTIALQRSFAL
jgi:hypothetical protein